VWTLGSPAGYSIAVEAEAVRALAAEHGWASFHLVGFSAGATVALATALRFDNSVISLTLIEPAYIGDDAWSPAEAQWRARMTEVFSLPPDLHQQAFAEAMMPPGKPVPSGVSASRDVIERGRLLESQALRQLGWSSGDLRALPSPTLVVTGGRSAARFAAVGDRLCEVLPNCRAALFPERHHLSSPQRNEPERLATLLVELWSSKWKPRRTDATMPHDQRLD
jgi:pimeloyl-ACP methyl ester carboxylesterase